MDPMIVLASQFLPQPTPDTQEQEVRGDGYGGLMATLVGSPRHALAGEGSYNIATTPTPGTAVAYGSGGTQASFSSTTGFVIYKNNGQPGVPQPLQMYLDYLRILVTGTVPASATSTQFAITIDTANRAPTANFSLLTPVNMNFRSGRGPVGQVWIPSAGIPTVPAAVNARLVARGSLRQAISVTLDEYILRFGAQDGSPAVAGGTGVGRYASDAPPVVLGPQEFCVIHLWQPSAVTNALSVELETGWYER
jgi:hypothetical protein